jgi:AcrR family transcriptional regulator
MSYPSGAASAEDEGRQAGEARERVLDAAAACFLRFGLAKTTMEDVAQAAGVSRATVYRQFRNRDDLLRAVVTRESSRLAAEAERYRRHFDDVGSWLVEGLLFALREAPRRPLLAMLFDPENVGRASRLVLGSEQFFEIGNQVLRPMFEPARERGLLREGIRLELCMEWVLRTLVSYLTVPSRLASSEDDLRNLLRMMILPAVLKSPAPEPAPETAHTKERSDG